VKNNKIVVVVVSQS